VALGGIIAGLANENWKDMDDQARFLFCCGVALSVLKSIDMLVDQTISNLRNHTGETTFFTKPVSTETNQKTQQ
jgi:hypothetical protein